MMVDIVKLISWNMKQRASNWTVLADLMREHAATAAMVQEAVAPPSVVLEHIRVCTDPALADGARQIPVPPMTTRKFASAVAVQVGVATDVWPAQPLAEAAYSAPVISHPGQWVAVSIGEPAERVAVVSLYGLWETMPDNQAIYAEATLHRALSDLTLLFQARTTKRLVLAGDLNIWRGRGGKVWEPRYRTVSDRLGAYGLDLIGPHRASGTPLEGCPCGSAESACSHVQTYRHQHRQDSTPYQNDFAFARGVHVVSCVALDEEPDGPDSPIAAGTAQRDPGN